MAIRIDHPKDLLQASKANPGEDVVAQEGGYLHILRDGATKPLRIPLPPPPRYTNKPEKL